MANNEASDLVEAAITEALKLFTDLEEGDVLGDWLVIAHVSNPDLDKGNGYPMIFANGNVPNHIVRGLLQTAMLMLNRGELD